MLVRPISLVYPNGRTIGYDYGEPGDDSDRLSRVESITETVGQTTTAYAGYTYLGDGTIVSVAHPDVANVLTLSYGSAGNGYSGLDPFGRVADQDWEVNGSSIDRYSYTYSAAGNRSTRGNELAGQFSEAYTYDALDRLTDTNRGGTNYQDWTLDQLGNWSTFDDQGTEQARQTNEANEITGIAGGSAGGVTYDAAGNMTFDGTSHYRYDAWNRLVTVTREDATGTSVFADDFNRTDGSLGSRWAADQGMTGSAAIASNAVAASGDVREVVQAVTGGNETVTGDYNIQMRFRRPDYAPGVERSADDVYLFVRASGDLSQSIRLRVHWDYTAATTTLYLEKMDDGTATDIATPVTVASLPDEAEWRTLRLAVRGDNLLAQVLDGTTVEATISGATSYGNQTPDEQYPERYTGTAVGWGVSLATVQTPVTAADDFAVTEPAVVPVAEYQYDARGYRTRKTVGATTTDYYYNENWQVLQENVNGVAHVQYVWDIRYIDSPVVRFRDMNADGDFADAGDETLYYTTDANWNVTVLVNPAGEVVERYVYDAYGKLTVLNGQADADSNVADWSPDADNTSDWGNTRGYTGKPLDAETGLLYFNARYYHTQFSFISRDPLGYPDGMNAYGYCGDDPINNADPSGLETLEDYKKKRTANNAEIRGLEGEMRGLLDESLAGLNPDAASALLAWAFYQCRNALLDDYFEHPTPEKRRSLQGIYEWRPFGHAYYVAMHNTQMRVMFAAAKAELGFKELDVAAFAKLEQKADARAGENAQVNAACNRILTVDKYITRHGMCSDVPLSGIDDKSKAFTRAEWWMNHEQQSQTVANYAAAGIWSAVTAGQAVTFIGGRLAVSRAMTYAVQARVGLAGGLKRAGAVAVGEAVAIPGRTGLVIAPESQGTFQMAARWENVPPRLWLRFPRGVPRPTGIIRVINGRTYSVARTAANRINQAISNMVGLGPRGLDVHEILPVKFGGSPVDFSNKVLLLRPLHRQVTAWFNRFMRFFE